MTNIYAYPNYTDGNGLTGLFTYVNTVSEGILMPLVMLGIFVIVFIIMLYNSRASHSFLISCFITGVLSIPFAILGYLAASYMYILGIGLAIGIFWASLDK